MPFLVGDNTLDTALDDIKTNGDLLCFCEDYPTSYADANTAKGSGGKKLAELAVTSGDYTGPADGATDGRKLTVNASTANTIDVTGYLNHIAVVDVSATELMAVVEVTTTRDNTAQAGGATTITLDTGASASDDAYNGQSVMITGGTGTLYEIRHITDYVGSTKVATVDSSWTTNPDATTTFRIFGKLVTTGGSETFDVAAFDLTLRDAVLAT